MQDMRRGVREKSVQPTDTGGKALPGTHARYYHLVFRRMMIEELLPGKAFTSEIERVPPANVVVAASNGIKRLSVERGQLERFRFEDIGHNVAVNRREGRFLARRILFFLYA
jgi:hypothetical protein